MSMSSPHGKCHESFFSYKGALMMTTITTTTKITSSTKMQSILIEGGHDGCSIGVKYS